MVYEEAVDLIAHHKEAGRDGSGGRETPRRASSRAKASPIPSDAPVTSAKGP